jgi:hypothetical protein
MVAISISLVRTLASAEAFTPKPVAFPDFRTLPHVIERVSGIRMLALHFFVKSECVQVGGPKSLKQKKAAPEDDLSS